MNYRHVIIDDFLSVDEITSLSYNHKILVESDTGDLTLYHQDRVSQSIVDKISNAIGKVDVRKSHVYNLTQPYRLHCDSGFDNNAFYTVIVPLDKEPQGGIFVMNQWADHAYSLDNYYKQNDQPVLSFEEQKEKINEFNPNTKNLNVFLKINKTSGIKKEKINKFPLNRLLNLNIKKLTSK